MASTGPTLRALSDDSRLKSAARATSQGSHGLPENGPRREGTDAGAVVVTETVAVASLVPSSTTEVGEIEHVAACGAPLQVKPTVPVNPMVEEKVSV